MLIKKNIVIMYAISFFSGMIFYGPIATLYRQAAGLDIFQITLIESISMALCVALELPCGMLADRIGYKNMLLCVCWLYFLSKVVFWKAAGFGMFLLERLMLSFIMAGLSGLDTSILYLSCAPERAQSVFGTYNNLNTAGLLIAAGVYSLFIGSNFRLAGFLTVISYGVMAVPAFFITDVKPPERERGGTVREFKSIFRDVLKNPRLIMLVAGAALLNETHQTVTVFLNQLQYVRCGISDRTIGLIYIGVTLSGLCGGFSARMTERLGERSFGAALYVVSAAACAAMAVFADPVLSVAAIVLMRVCFSLFQPLQTQLQNRQITSPNRATALSINAVMMESVGIATNLVFGAAAKAALPLALALGGIFCVGGLALFLPGSRAAE